MTILLYQTDSFLQEFHAHVIGVEPEGRGVILDRTSFYPGGGGQPNDLGWISSGTTSFRVERVRKNQDTILHYLDGTEKLPEIHSEIQGKLDWERRYQLMRTHSALHVLCGVVFHDYGALVTGGDMEPLKGRMDFEFESMHGDLVREIEKRVNQEVEAGHDIRVKILPREEAFQIPDLIRTKINLLPEGIREVRIVEIVGLDLQADGGTHVMNTNEIGKIKVVDYKSKGAINKRIYIEVQ